MEAERELYDFAVSYAQTHRCRDAEKELVELGPPPHQSKSALLTVIKWSHEFGGEIYKQTRADDLLSQAFTSSQYSLLDDLNIGRGAKFSSEHLWRAAYDIDLFRSAPRLDVPVFILAGRHDYAVTATVARHYFDALVAPKGKQFVWFEHSSHYPNFEEPQKFREVMRGISKSP